MTTADKTSLKLDWELVDGKTNIHGRTIGITNLRGALRDLLEPLGPEEFALAIVSSGDSFAVDVAFFADGEQIELDDLLTLKFGIKEIETGLLYSLNSSAGDDWQAVVSASGTRYRIPIKFESGQMLQILTKYADPLGTFADVLAEVEATFSYRVGQSDVIANPGDPGVQYLAASATETMSTSIDLGLEDGESRDFALTAEVENRYATFFSIYAQSSEPLYNVQSASGLYRFTATNDGGTVTLSDVTTPGSVTRQQIPDRQFQAVPVWLSEATFAAPVVSGGSVVIECDVETEAFDNASFVLPSNAWASDIVAHSLSWSFFGKAYRGADQWKAASPTGLSAPFWDTLDIYLVDDGGAEHVLAQMTRHPDGSLSGLPEMATPLATALDTAQIMAGHVGASANATSTEHHEKFRILFTTDPDAVAVRLKYNGGASGTEDFAVSPVALGTQSPIKFSTSFGAVENPTEDAVGGRKTTDDFVLRLRRDLIPDATIDLPVGST